MSGPSGKTDNPDLLLAEAGAGPAPVATIDYAPPGVAPSTSLKSRAVRGSVWTMSAFGIGQLLRIISSPILAWLLVPADFGTIALVMVFVTAVHAFGDVGIEQAIIQS